MQCTTWIPRGLLLMAVAALAVGCGTGSGAVRFAPTPVPPDVSPLRYTHPSGAFSIQVPRLWAVQERNAVTLASAAFSIPDEHITALDIAAVQLETTPNGSAAITEILNLYQMQVRPDAARYTEQSREAMGDGSWRLTGLRTAPTGATQPVNTFIEFDGATVGVVEVVLTGDADRLEAVQSVLNTFELNTESALEPTGLNTLAFANSGRLEPLNIHAWTTDDGTFFITGEVANYSNDTLMGVPVSAVLYTGAGRVVVEAEDTLMGHGIAPGEFAPFSLRFGQGQPPLTTRYSLALGDETWTPPADGGVIGVDALTWTDESAFTDAGILVITGEVSNTSDGTYIYEPRVVVTVFNDQQQVIAARFEDLSDVEIEPGETVPFQVNISEMGGTPDRYILNVQGRP